MKTILILIPCAACACLLAACDDKGRYVRMNENRDAATPGGTLPLPGDATQEHWSGPTSGKAERNLPDPVTGTPNQAPNR